MGDIPYNHYVFLAIDDGNGGIEHANSCSLSFSGKHLGTEPAMPPGPTAPSVDRWKDRSLIMTKDRRSPCCWISLSGMRQQTAVPSTTSWSLYQEFYQQKKRGFSDAEFRQVCETVADAPLVEVFSYATTTKDIDYNKYLA